MKRYAMAAAESFQRAVGCFISILSGDINHRAVSQKPSEITFSEGSGGPETTQKLAEAGLEPARSIRNSGF